MKSRYKLTLFLALVLGAAAPTVGAAPSPMARVERELQSGGEVYFLLGPASLRRHLSEVYRSLERGIAESELPDREHTQSLLAFLRILTAMSGIADVAAAGCSSIPDAGFGFSNRAALAAAPGRAAGWLWRTHGKAEPRLARIGGFPADTAFALDFGVDLLPILKDLDGSGCGKLIAEYLDGIDLLTPSDWLRSLSGDWQFAVAIPDGQNWDHDRPFLSELKKCDIFLSVPDDQGRLKKLLELFSASEPSARRTGNVIYISDGDDATSVFVTLERRILYFSSVRCFDKFGDGSANVRANGKFVPGAAAPPGHKTLAGDPKFAAALKRFPGNSHGAYFSDNSRTGGVLRIGGKGGFQMKLPRERGRSVGIWTMDRGTIVNRELSTESLTVQVFDTFVGVPLLLAADRMLHSGRKAKKTAPPPTEKTGPNDDEAKEAEAAEKSAAECRKNLLEIKRVIDEYAAKHDGKLPSTLPATPKCGNSGYVYFAPFAAPPSGKMPLVADPVGADAHPGTVNVLFVDGTIESFDLDADSVKRLCSFLHTVYRYEEKEFIRLIELASQLDEKKERDHERK